MSLFKRFTQPDPPPGWAVFMSPREFKEFSDDVKEVLNRHAPDGMLRLKEGTWTTAEGTVHDLLKLAHMYMSQSIRDRRLSLIEDYVLNSIPRPEIEDAPEELLVEEEGDPHGDVPRTLGTSGI